MSKAELKKYSYEQLQKISDIGNMKGQTPSSMITLAIPPKYCI